MSGKVPFVDLVFEKAVDLCPVCLLPLPEGEAHIHQGRISLTKPQYSCRITGIDYGDKSITISGAKK